MTTVAVDKKKQVDIYINYIKSRFTGLTSDFQINKEIPIFQNTFDNVVKKGMGGKYNVIEKFIDNLYEVRNINTNRDYVKFIDNLIVELQGMLPKTGGRRRTHKKKSTKKSTKKTTKKTTKKRTKKSKKSRKSRK